MSRAVIQQCCTLIKGRGEESSVKWGFLANMLYYLKVISTG